MKLSQLICELETITRPDVDTEITAVCYDSRKVTNGSAFICLVGTNFDGHEYASLAEKAGASVIIAQKQTESALPHVIVRDSREAMFEIAAQWFGHPERDMKFVGVTGTNGKTSTVFYIKSMLDKMGKKTGLIGTVSNMIGDKTLPSASTTPEPYALFELLSQMRDENVEYVAMEISSHSLDQKRVSGIKFEVAVFINLTQDHLDYHGTMENYKKAKFGIFELAKTAVINIDDETGKEFADMVNIPKYTYSTIYNSADFVAKEIKIRVNGVKFLAVTRGGIAKVYAPTPGGFTVYNILAAIGAVSALGFEFSEIEPTLSEIVGVCGRAEIISGNRPYTVMIDYAHTPDGVENILSSVREYAQGRVITLFGCGGNRDKTKRPIMGSIAAKYSDYVIVTSDNPRTEQPMSIIEDILPGVQSVKTPYTVIENRQEAIKFAIENAKENDVIVLAGKGHEDYQVIGTQKIPFDEHAIAKKYMEDMEK
ncbi:MAG: UDP-N-acetylmuramoyl-L-alanyl-D-glutamate--2,6-diaminopimelate ligase [Clostridia bacterium]|nr:UDP-N-acetylmuramoyl-L-alanyl-D-glutamate--2,6-diaminopimelate ligase [Clostridia bacterium]